MERKKEKAAVRFMGQKDCYIENSKKLFFEGARRAFSMEYTIKYKNGHIEVYDFSGRFLFSADSMEEARWDLQEMDAAS